MAAIELPDFIDDRAEGLAGANLNGVKLALVSLPAGPSPPHADIELHFFSALHLPAIVAAATADPLAPRRLFRVRGGSRVPAGNLDDQVHVAAVAIGSVPARLALRIAPVGDYSTYTLELVWDGDRIDPFFAAIGFKFRPGCFTNDCAPRRAVRPQPPAPVIDYLAKDYDSFRHVMMTAMAQRVPGWQSTSEADLDQVLIDLFAAAGDELSDFQDRVMAEAGIGTLRKRASLVRHARLVDYHVSEGNQASTWLRVGVVPGTPPFRLDAQELVVGTGAGATGGDRAVIFGSRQARLLPERRQWLDPRLNQLGLHTWQDARPGLAAGSTSADIVPAGAPMTAVEADSLRDLVREGKWREMAIVELLNPRTGAVPGHSRAKRQLLRLLPGTDPDAGAAMSIRDPVTGTWLVRVNWREDDKLRFDYAFTTYANGSGPAVVPNVSAFFGNLVPVHHGRPMSVRFHEPGTVLPTVPADVVHRHFERMDRFRDGKDWVLARLPDEGPLAYLPPTNTLAPVGEEPARSTIRMTVIPAASATATTVSGDVWDEVTSLVQSDDSPERGDSFVVETDERRRTVLRLGNGTNGQLVPAGAAIHVEYQAGGGTVGNVGADTLVHFTQLANGAIQTVRNPFDVVDGRDAETIEQAIRNAPEAFRARQLRAVTLGDYVARAEEVTGVSRAFANYAWTGSWRTVRVAVDPAGFVAIGDSRSDRLWQELRPRVAAHLEAVRLIGEDIELRPPRYVALDIRIEVCAEDAYWREDIRNVLEGEFSDGWTSDGRRGFFHPDEWTFGRALHRSAIEGRIHQVTGIGHIVRITMKRFSSPLPAAAVEILPVRPDEIVLLANDPSHLERGRIRFGVQGGRR